MPLQTPPNQPTASISAARPLHWSHTLSLAHLSRHQVDPSLSHQREGARGSRCCWCCYCRLLLWILNAESHSRPEAYCRLLLARARRKVHGQWPQTESGELRSLGSPAKSIGNPIAPRAALLLLAANLRSWRLPWKRCVTDNNNNNKLFRSARLLPAKLLGRQGEASWQHPFDKSSMRLLSWASKTANTHCCL